MAVIKCSRCENEILDTEVVCPYCDCPVVFSKENQEQLSKDESASSHTVKIASREDFESEKAALMQKLANEEKSLNNSADGKTVVISKNEFRAEKKGDTDKIPSRAVKEKASKIRISTPDAPQLSNTRSSSAGRNSKKPKEKGKKLIVAVTLIGVLLIAYLIYALFSNIQSNMSSLKTKENKKAVVSSDAEVIDKGFKFPSSSTLVITSNDVMEDYESASSTPWADKADQIKHITIEDSIDRIADYAFAHFTALEDVVFGKNVAEIGKEAFYGCESLERVTFRSDSKLRTVKNNAFTNCESLESFELGTAIRSIGSGAFKSCSSLTEMEIPANVKIGDDAFLGCDSDFTIICKKDSSAHKYADTYGIDVEFTGKDANDDTDDDDYYYTNDEEDTDKSSSDKKDESKKNNETKDSKDNKDNKDSKENKDNKDNKDNTENKGDNDTGKTNNTTTSTGSTNSNSNADTSKSRTEIVSELTDANKKLSDPNTTAEQKSELQSKIDELSKELNGGN